MAKSKRKKKKTKKKSGSSSATRRWLWVIALIVLFVYSLLIWSGGGGLIGEPIYRLLYYLFGQAYFLVPLSLAAGSASIIYSLSHQLETRRIIAGLLFIIALLVGIQLLLGAGSGGIIGGYLANIGITLLGPIGIAIITIATAVGSLIVVLSPDYDPQDLGERLRKGVNIGSLFSKTHSADDEYQITGGEPDDDGENVIMDSSTAQTHSVAEAKQPTDPAPAKLSINKNSKSDDNNSAEFVLPGNDLLRRPYTPPPLNLLSGDKGKAGVGDIKANANVIKRTFQNFGIRVEMDEVSIGPTVTRYAFKPAEGVRLSKILSLQSNLELALAAHPVRIEAPIPGKALVGIEVPNSAKTTVGLASLLQSGEYRESDKPLVIALGKGISGSAFFTDIAKAPHMLIAGATGSGKSVTLHVLINSLLFRNSPEDLRLIMVDPKRVELTLYNGIPHLLNPVITKPKKAVQALKWAVKEMERRYEVLQEVRVQNIVSYHQNIVAKAYKKADADTDSDALPEKMPYIVVILDEVGDLMQVYPKELEAEIIRLAQMSRAVGIHLVLTTQRPDKKVITGLIKANVPTRVALQVASNVESRIILDSSGAEDLLGAGDMLFQSAKMSKPVRVQSPFITEGEIKSVIKFITKQYDGEAPDEVDMSEDSQTTDLFSIDLESAESEEEDELYSEAALTVIKAGKASTSYLQRRLRIGYSRAARIMDMLEENGVISAQDGSKPRDVLVDEDSFNNSDSDN